MASATLDSKAAFEQRARQVGVEEVVLTALKAAGFDTFGSLAFAVPHSPTRQDEEVFVAFLKRVNGGADPTQIQVACMRRLFYESHTLALSDLKQRVESGPDPAQQTRRLPTAERVARQNEQETRLAGIVFSLEVMPSHRFVEMAESGILAYISPDNCTSRAQEVQCVKKDAAISLDSAGVLKLHNKSADLVVDTGTEVCLRSAWLRRSLAMDQAGLVKFQTIEKRVQYLFLQLCKDQPKNFSTVTLHQIVECVTCRVQPQGGRVCVGPFRLVGMATCQNGSQGPQLPAGIRCAWYALARRCDHAQQQTWQSGTRMCPFLEDIARQGEGDQARGSVGAWVAQACEWPLCRPAAGIGFPNPPS